MQKEVENTQQLGRSIIPLSAVPAQGSVVEGLKDSERVGAVSFDMIKMVNECVICGNPLKEDDLTDSTGLVHLRCAIEVEKGCYDSYGVFIYCFECWNPCCYRQQLPVSDLKILQRIRGKNRFFIGTPSKQ